jgi:two-component system, OmpR family, sensor histidine kinase VicK
MLPSNEEKTEVVYGTKKILEKTFEGSHAIKECVDGCFDYTCLSSFSMEPFKSLYAELNERGIRQRLITEINEDNLLYAKEAMKFCQIRHLDRVAGNFGIGDRKEIRIHAIIRESKIPTQMLISNVRAFVEQQQYFFDELWKKAIPAEERIREIEQGAKREFVETIRDSYEIQKVGSDLIKSAKEDILIFFSAASTFHYQAMEGGILRNLLEEMTVRKALPQGVKIRILVPMDNEIRNEMVEKIRRLGIDIRDNKKPLHVKFANLIVDNKFSLTVELKDDTKKPKNESIGLATYSNSESLISSYVSMFETLWIQNEKE